MITRERRQEIYDQLTVPLVVLAYVWLLLFSCMLPHQGPESFSRFSSSAFVALGVVLVLLWGLYGIDFALYLSLLEPGAPGRWKRVVHGLGSALCPLFRISHETSSRPGEIWVPGLGWQVRDRELFKRLRRLLGGPMICVVLLVLPIMGVEFLKQEWLRFAWVQAALALGSQVIWYAFAVEYTLMLSVTHKPRAYAVRHWLDLAIILLPVILFIIPFLFFLPALRLVRLTRLARVARTMRMRGAGMKAVRALTLFSFSKRFFKGYHQRRIRTLNDELEELEYQMEEMREEIAELEAELREEEEAEYPAG